MRIMMKQGKKLKDLQIFKPRAVDENFRTVKRKTGTDFLEFKKKDIRQSIVDRFEAQVAKFPGNIAVKTKNHWYTYKELNEISNQIARTILALTFQKQEGVALLFEHDAQMIAAMLAVLKSRNFYIPLDPTHPAKRLVYMLKDSNSKFLLTNHKNKKMSEALISRAQNEIKLIYIDKIDKNLSHKNLNIKINPGNLAYILYTSGSTGVPKGVIQNHGNVLHFIRVYTNNLRIHAQDRLTLFSVYSFDAAVMDIYGAVLNGAALYPYDLKDKGGVLDISRWLREERMTIFHSIPTVFRYFADTFSSGDRFPDIRYVVMGGEAVSSKDVEIYKRYFNDDCIFINGLGPTESTVTLQYFITKEIEIAKHNIPVGFPVEETKVFLLDERDRLALVNQPGEIVYKSEFLMLGYLNQQEKTAEVLVTDPVEKKGRVYRSGDLGKCLPDGSIQYVSRKDSQVKIRGYRIELAEIERVLDTVEGIKRSVVICQRQPDNNRDNLLVAYYVNEKEKEIKKDTLIKILKDALPDYMLPSAFLSMDRLPLTPSGKIDRKALPTLEIEAGEEYIGPRNEIETKIAGIWSEVLGIEKKLISIDSNFFQSGGHSLRAAIMASKIHKELNVELPLAEIFKTPTISGLSAYIRGIGKQEYLSIQPVEKKEYYPLSSAQRRLYILRQMEADNISYNLQVVLILEGELNRRKIEKVFAKLISRHESLRTSFEMVGNEPLQRVHKKVAFIIDYYDLVTDEDNNKLDSLGGKGVQPLVHGSRFVKGTIKNFIGAFDLLQAPLLRVGLIKVEPQKHILMVDMHHIITDGTSQEVFVREFMTLYGNRGEEFPALRLQYKDFSGWQNNESQKKAIIKQEGYWKQRFAGEIPVLHLPTDYPRPAVQSFDGGRISFQIQEQEVNALNQLALAQGTSLYMILLSLFTIFLAKITGQQDIVVGTPIAGRRHDDLQQIIGMFVNTLGIRNYPDGEKIFSGFLQEVKEIILAAFENQDYPFEDLVETVAVNRDAGRNPLFDVMFVLQNMDRTTFEIPCLKLRPYDYENRTSKFDLTLNGVEFENSLQFTFEYCTKLLKAETIERFTHYFRKIIFSVIKDTGQKIGEIDIIPDSEKQLLLHEFNNTYARYSKDKTLHQLFEEQVEQNPDHIAVIGEMQSAKRRAQSKEQNVERCAPCAMHCALTYRELNEKSNQLAHLLNKKGVQSDTIIGIMVERSLEMIIGILGILKACGAYLPIDPDYPNRRIKFMLTDSRAKFLVITHELLMEDGKMSSREDRKLGNWNGDKIILNVGNMPDCSANQPATGSPQFGASPFNLCYVSYTSGSTGKPRGILIGHGNVVNFIKGITSRIAFETGKSILALTTISFDIFVLETLLPLTKGLKVIIANKQQQSDPELLKNILNNNHIEMVQVTPSRLQLMMENSDCLRGVKVLMVGGETFPGNLFKSLPGEFNGQVYNLYGPTETTVWSTLKELTAVSGITIGKPLANTQVYIVNRYGQFQPVGIAGELCIGGAGVARGYLNQPELTAEKFGHDLWGYQDYHDGYHRSYRSYKSYNFYKTGDLARWLPDGNIKFLGRIDHQVKIRGFRIEPGEIESHLLNHEAIHEAVVQVKEDPKKEKYLCAYIVTKNSGTKTDSLVLRDYLSKKLPDYMIPNHFIYIDTIPLTPSGKIDRKALPEPKIKVEQGYIAPQDPVEKKLAEIWAEVLGIDRNIIGIDANFFELGGHSLKGTRLISKIHKEFHVNIPLMELFRTPTIKGFAQHIKKAAPDKFISIEPVEKKEFYDVSYSQRRLWSVTQFEKEQTAYNLPMALEIKQLNREAFEKAFKTLVIRHESLRTTFLSIKGEPKQKIHDHESFGFNVKYIDLRKKEKAEEKAKKQVHQETQTVFELNTPPLIRVTLLHLHNERYLCIIVMHHIISDGWSTEVTAREILTLYHVFSKGKENPLPPLKIQYKDFSQWQNKQLSEKNLNTHREYWLNQFSGEIPLLNLKTDYPRPQIQTFNGDSIIFNLDKDITLGLKKISKRNKASLFMTLQAGVKALLYYYTGQIDIVIGTPIAGREHSDLEDQIGYYLNILPLRTNFTANVNFEQLLNRVKHITLGAYSHQVYPFDLLLNDLNLKRQTGRSPLFDVLVHMLNTEIGPESEKKIQETLINPWDVNLMDSKFDLTVNLFEEHRTIRVQFKFNTDLFKRETILRMAERFKTLLENIVKNTTTPLSQLNAEKKPRIPTLQPISIKRIKREVL